MTVTIENTYTGNGSTTNYSFTFPYLDETDIKASLDGVVTTNFRLLNATTVQFVNNTTANTPTAPGNNVAIRIYRETAYTNPKATFYPGAAIRAGDLNDNTLQNLYVTQEANDKVNDAWLTGDPTIISTEDWYTTDDTKVATTKAIENRVTAKIKSALNDDVIGGQSITVTDNSPSDGKITVAVTNGSIGTTQLANDAVTGAKILDDTIDSEHYAAGSIDNEHLANDAVGADELAANAVVNASVKSDAAIEFTKLENLDSAKILVGNGSNKATEVAMSGDVAISNTGATTIQTGAVEHSMLANDCIDGDNIQDDVVNSEHLAAGSIDTEHIADANVTLAKIENVADTKIIVGNGSNRPTAVTVSGDVSIANTGAVTIANDAINANKIADNAVTTDHIQDAELTTLAGMQSGTASILADSTALTATTAELNLLDNKTFRASGDGSLTTTSDTEIPSSKVIAAHVSSTILATGGFISINNEVSFPTTANQPANGVIVSISDAAGTVINGSGTSTTGRTTDGTPATVTINNFPSSLYGETLATGVGMLVTSTGSSNIYNYHKILAAEADVKQLSDDINDFNARYRVAGSAPGSNNDAGDMYFDTTANKMKVYNGTTSTWDDVASVGNFFINTISSSSNTGGGSATFNGSAYRFTLSNPPTMAQQLIVSVNGVIQKPDAGTGQPSEGFAINGNDIIFSAAPASGSDYFIVTQGSSVSIGTPSDNTVSTAKLQNLGVTTAKIAADAVDGTKIADDAVGAEHIEVLDANLQFGDSVQAQFGASNDLKLYHNGSHNYIESANGNTILYGGGTQLKAVIDGQVELYHDNSKKLETTSDGALVSGALGINGQNLTHAANTLKIGHEGSGVHQLRAYGPDGSNNGKIQFNSSRSDGSNPKSITYSSGNLEFPDSQKATFGTGSDLEIYHDGTDSQITNATGNLFLKVAGTEKALAAVPNGATELYHNNNKKFETTSTGVDITGTLNVNGSPLSAAPEITAVATGSIGANASVQLNSDGTVSVVSRATPAIGTKREFHSGAVGGHIAACYNPTDKVVAVIYRQTSGWIKYGTVNGDEITFSSATEWTGNAVEWLAIAHDPKNNAYFISYRDDSNGYGYAFALSANGTTYGTKSSNYQWTNNNAKVSHLAWASFAEQMVIARINGSALLVQTLAYNGSSTPTTGSAVSSESSASGHPSLCVDATNSKVYLSYYNSNLTEGFTRLLTISGTSISQTNASTWHTYAAYYIKTVYDTTNSKLIVTFTDGNDSEKAKVRAGTINHSNNQISWSNAVEIDGSGYSLYTAAVFNSDRGKIDYYGKDHDDYLYYVEIDASGTHPTCATKVILDNSSGNNNWSAATWDSDTLQTFNFYEGESSHGDYISKDSGASSLTAENFLGFSSAAYTNGQTATINVVGNTTTQSSLTPAQKYYIQLDGTLGLSPVTPSVEAGLALSSTKLLIKG